MSADNYISVQRNMAGKYVVRYGFTSGDYSTIVSAHETLEEAVSAAHDYERKVGYVEYGVRVEEGTYSGA